MLRYIALLLPAFIVACAVGNTSDTTDAGASKTCETKPFGLASDFNLYVLENLSTSNSDTEGRIAVGGYADFQDYSVGAKLQDSPSRRDLIVGHQLLFARGSVSHGSIATNSEAIVENVFVLGGVQHLGRFPFAETRYELESRSRELGSMAVNGHTSVIFDGGSSARLVLNGNSRDHNVFVVSSEDLALANSLTLSAPEESNVVINVLGSSAVLKQFGFSYQGVQRNHVLFNFPQTTSIQVENLGLEGSMLAPFAALQFRNGVMSGNVAVKSMVGNGQVNHDPHQGCGPGGPKQTPTPSPTPSPTSVPPKTPTPTPVPTKTPEKIPAEKPSVQQQQQERNIQKM